MSNMSYCRFENTLKDLNDCLNNFNDIESTSEKKYVSEMLQTIKDFYENNFDGSCDAWECEPLQNEEECPECNKVENECEC